MAKKMSLSKMSVTFPVYGLEKFMQPGVISIEPRYSLHENLSEVNIGNQVKFFHEHKYECVSCQKVVKKLYSSFCFPCLKTKAMADGCVLNPVKCHFHKGTCREEDWGKEFCFQPHAVYIAFTDKHKVGITRFSNIPSRWVDQGAVVASLLAMVPSRHQAGIFEDLLSKIVSDKSNWRKMLLQGNELPNLENFLELRRQLVEKLKSELNEKSILAPLPKGIDHSESIKIFDDAALVKIRFPIHTLPSTFSSISLEKKPSLEEKVLGIKGQYLIFEDAVFNVRRHEGFIVEASNISPK